MLKDFRKTVRKNTLSMVARDGKSRCESLKYMSGSGFVMYIML